MEAALDSVGRLVVPKALRDALGLTAGSKVDISLYGAGLAVVPVGRTARLVEEDGRLVAESNTAVTDDDRVRPARVDPTVTLLALDTSVAIPLLVRTHQWHAAARSAIAEATVCMTGHSQAETYSVLTRLPGDARVDPHDAARLLSVGFERPLLIDGDLVGAPSFRIGGASRLPVERCTTPWSAWQPLVSTSPC